MKRRLAVVETWGVAALPWTFAAAGLGLGAGALATERPLVGACGAVAGVAAGLLERHRAGVAERRTELLRGRLREQRADAEVTASELRREVRELRNELWQRDLDAVVAAGAAYVPVLERAEEPAGPTTGEFPSVALGPASGGIPVVLGPPSGPIAQVIDISARSEERADERAEEQPAAEALEEKAAEAS